MFVHSHSDETNGRDGDRVDHDPNGPARHDAPPADNCPADDQPADDHRAPACHHAPPAEHDTLARGSVMRTDHRLRQLLPSR